MPLKLISANTRDINRLILDINSLITELAPLVAKITNIEAQLNQTIIKSKADTIKSRTEIDGRISELNNGIKDICKQMSGMEENIHSLGRDVDTLKTGSYAGLFGEGDIAIHTITWENIIILSNQYPSYDIIADDENNALIVRKGIYALHFSASVASKKNPRLQIQHALFRNENMIPGTVRLINWDRLDDFRSVDIDCIVECEDDDKLNASVFNARGEDPDGIIYVDAALTAHKLGDAQ